MTQDFLKSTTQTIAWLKNSSDDGELDMSPPFQRNPVWTDAQKSYLIESILLGYPVPEIYLQTSADEHGQERHVVVDGQQRIRACLEFVEGSYVLVGLNDRLLNGQTFDDLSPAQRKKIYNYNFVVRLLPELTDEEIRGIFQRLNRNVVSLSRQELRHATYWGEFIQSVEGLAKLEGWRGSGVFTANEIRRMLDIEFVSELVIGMIHGAQNKKTSLERFYAAYEEEFDERADIEERFPRVLRRILRLVPEINATRWRKKSDFYTLFLLLSGYDNDPHRAPAIDDGEFGSKLREFGQMVDELVALDVMDDVPRSAAAVSYARGVQRAASDLANRRTRAASLDSFLRGEDVLIAIEDATADEEPTEGVEEDQYDDE